MNSAWKIEYDPAALKQLRKFDRTDAARIVRKLQSGLDRHGEPHAFGDALVGG